MKRKVVLRLFALILLAVMSLSLCSCGKHYCSYGGCMVEVEHEGDRCSRHKGRENNPYYGWPSDWIPDNQKYRQGDG